MSEQSTSSRRRLTPAQLIVLFALAGVLALFLPTSLSAAKQPTPPLATNSQQCVVLIRGSEVSLLGCAELKSTIPIYRGMTVSGGRSKKSPRREVTGSSLFLDGHVEFKPTLIQTLKGDAVYTNP